MSGKYPYVTSAGPIIKTISQLRKSFPKEVNSDTLKKLGIAPNNESYVISTLKFLKVIDAEGKKPENIGKVFSNHDNEAFAKEFSPIVKSAYHELFELHGEDAWSLSKPELTQFFRTSDQSSDIVGHRQAITFNCLASLTGHADIPETKLHNKSAEKADVKSKKPKVKQGHGKSQVQGNKDAYTDTSNIGTVTKNNKSDVGLTVRIEVNLPAGADQSTYDAIFKSIKKNLLDE